MGRLIHFRRRRLPTGWASNLRRRQFAADEIRVMVWSGLLAGLLFYQGLRLWPPPDAFPAPPSVADAPDPYPESRRSRTILEAQEGAPRARSSPRSVVRGSTAAVRVIDGDTFEHGGMRIRIADIDTPELRGRCAYETDLAGRAKARLRTLLAAEGFELHPAPNGRDEDRYGRKLRIVTSGGRSIGDVLVAEGLARTWTGRREPWCG